MSIKAIWRWLISVTAIIILFITMMMTPSGLSLSLSLAKLFLPGHLQYQQVSGVLTGPIKIKNLKYDSKDLSLSIEQLQMHWNPLTLLWDKLTISQLNINHVFLTLKNNSEKKKSKPIDLPFKLQITNVQLHNVAIGTQANQYPTVIQTINMKAILLSNKVDLHIQTNLTKPFPMKAVLDVTGDFSHYKLSLHLNHSRTAWLISGNGNSQGIQLGINEKKTLGGSLFGKANFQWAQQAWNISLQAKHLNLNQLKQTWPRQLNIRFAGKQQIIDDQQQLTTKTYLSTPKAKLTLNANYKNQWDIQWNAAIIQLSSVLPTARGSLYSQGKWSGTIEHPLSQGTIRAHALSAFSYRARSLIGNWNINPSNNTVSTVNISAINLATPNITLQKLQLLARGTRPSHRISALARINNQTFKLQLQGKLFENKWEGQLQKLNITSRRFANLHLIKSSRILISPDMISVNMLCLQSTFKNRSLCLDGKWDANNDWKLTAKGQKINLGVIAHIILPKLSFSAPTNVDAMITGHHNKIRRAYANLSFLSGHFRYVLNGRPIKRSFQKGSIVRA